MKAIILYDQPELFVEYLEARFPEVAFICCRSYEVSPGALEERRSAEMFGDNLARRLRGESLENIVDPRRGY